MAPSVAPTAIAHRGDPLSRRENTLGAFTAAVAQGADMVELDLQRTKDGAIVVLHDATLHRLWETDRAVADTDLAEVWAIGHGDERIPTLEEVIEAVEVPLMVDFTGPEVVAGAIEVCRRRGAVERSVFVSGNLAALELLRGSAPEAALGVTWTEDRGPDAALLRRLGASLWNPWAPVATADRVRAAHEAGFEVSTWTVDEETELERVLAAGVDAVVSNQLTPLLRRLGPARKSLRTTRPSR